MKEEAGEALSTDASTPALGGESSSDHASGVVSGESSGSVASAKADVRGSDEEFFRFSRTAHEIHFALAPWRDRYLKQRGVKTAVGIVFIASVASTAVAVFWVLMMQTRVESGSVFAALLIVIITLPLLWLVMRESQRRAHAQLTRLIGFGELPVMSPGDGVIYFQPGGLGYLDSRSSFSVSWTAGAWLAVEGEMTWIMMGERRMMGIPTDGMTLSNELSLAVTRQDSYAYGLSQLKQWYLKGHSMRCRQCKQDLQGTTGDRCPECGGGVQVSDFPVGWWTAALAERNA